MHRTTTRRECLTHQWRQAEENADSFTAMAQTTMHAVTAAQRNNFAFSADYWHRKASDLRAEIALLDDRQRAAAIAETLATI